MKLVVIGGTGPLGQEVLQRGAAQGHSITALVRRPQDFGTAPKGVT
jgi:uncharacterized protein YbjT (DUF2867 family)